MNRAGSPPRCASKRPCASSWRRSAKIPTALAAVGSIVGGALPAGLLHWIAYRVKPA